MKPKRKHRGQAGELAASRRDSFPIVGIGASAGGLEAFTLLLQKLPADTGMGFVLVQHLDPVHESALTKLLSKHTAMPVHEVTDNLKVEPDHVYVIPPNTTLSIAAGTLKLQPRKKVRTPARTIDSFLESLAQDRRERAIGVVLSGTASDGTVGLEAIKAEGGITFAQDDSAKYDSMPHSAVAAGCVDLVLSPQDIAKELDRIARHPYVAGELLQLSKPEEDRAEATAHEDDDSALPSGGHGSQSTGATLALQESRKARHERRSTQQGDGFKKIVQLLRSHSGVDFSLYKSNTIQRRITRRVVLNKQESLDEYARFLRGNTKELDALYSDTLISVTSFFRNPEAFEVLKRKVFPKLLQERGDNPFRMWVLGCSTGQEAYSLAMAFMESADKAPRLRKLQVFATDLNDTLLDKARHGLYSKSLAGDVSPERLSRFFVEEEGGYRIVKSLREMVVFARQNLISDPPFSRMDLISCRNLLIYLEPSLQKRAVPVFHYALKPHGHLFLGASESIGGFTELFEPIDKKQKIYSKKAAPTPAFQLPAKAERGESSFGRMPRAAFPHGKVLGEPRQGMRGEMDAQREADRLTVNRFAPPGVLINSEMQILQFRGSTSPYLQPPSGKASFDVLKMAREGLMLPLRATINKAKKENRIVRRDKVHVGQNGGTRTVTIEVMPLKNLRERCYLVLFEDTGPDKHAEHPAAPARTRTPRHDTNKEEGRRSNELERELSDTSDYLQSIQEQYEAANEELQAANEEVQSANEELQSINEELETSKEELESANEELTTVNEEMANRNAELNRLNSDLTNLQTSTKLSILVLDRDQTIRRFSAQAEKQFSLLSTDIGRPISNLRHNLRVPDLQEFIAEVISSVRANEREVQDKDGRWYSLRVRPYLTVDNKIDGAVVVLVDINELRQALDYAQAIIGTVRQPLIVLDGDLRVRTANRSFYQDFHVSQKETENRFIYDLGNRQWDIPKLRTALEEVLPRNNQFENFEVEHNFNRLGHRTMLLNARRLVQPGTNSHLILLAIEDITERKLGLEALRASEEQFTSIFNQTTGGIAQTDLQGRFTLVNDRYCQIVGRSRDELLGMRLQDLTHPEDWPGNLEKFKALAEGYGPNFLIEKRYLRPDGSTVWVHNDVAAIRDAEGKVRNIAAAVTDITKRIEVDEALRLSEGRFRMLAENMAQLAWTCDHLGNVTWYNQRWLDYTGLTFEEMKGWDWVKVQHPDHVERVVARVKQSSETGELWEDTFPLRGRDGTYRWFLSRAVPLRNSVGEIMLWFGTNTDITEQRDAEEALRESQNELTSAVAREQEMRAAAETANRLKDEFLAIVSHEVRTPLNAITGWAHMLRSGKLNPDETLRGLETIERNTALQVRIINELLDASRIISGKLKLDAQPVELAAVIEAAVEVVHAASEAKSIQVDTKLDFRDGLVLGDSARLQQVVWNLLSNAIKFTPKGGRVQIQLRREDTSVAIAVKDNGEGIDPDFLPHAFDRFRQADASSTRAQGGLGLGLSIVRNLIEMHGGSVRAESQGKGKGSTFTVILPLRAISNHPRATDSGSLEQPSRQSATLETGAARLDGIQVLIVDDEPDTRDLLSLALTNAGAQVKVAGSASEALAAIKKLRPDCIVSDIGMPGEDGYALMKKVRALKGRDRQDIPAIALTGYAGAEDKSRASDAGFQAHLAKPVALRELISRISQLVTDRKFELR